MGRSKKIVDKTVVLDAAFGLIEAEGLEGFSTRRLAALLGLSSMTLYNYFDNREAILRAVALRGLADFFANYSARRAASEEARRHPLGAFLALAEEFLRFGRERPRLYLFLFDSSLADLRHDPEVARYFTYVLDECIARLKDERAASALREDVYLFLVLANALVINAIHGRADFDESVFRRLAERAYERLLAAHEGDFAD